jgi:hypothetical protein
LRDCDITNLAITFGFNLLQKLTLFWNDLTQGSLEIWFGRGG